MTLTEFQAEMTNDLEQFFIYYKGMHLKFPKEWPLAMNAGDWYEQFLSWNQQK